jgi:hypothetical protein
MLKVRVLPGALASSPAQSRPYTCQRHRQGLASALAPPLGFRPAPPAPSCPTSPRPPTQPLKSLGASLSLSPASPWTSPCNLRVPGHAVLTTATDPVPSAALPPSRFLARPGPCRSLGRKCCARLARSFVRSRSAPLASPLNRKRCRRPKDRRLSADDQQSRRRFPHGNRRGGGERRKPSSGARRVG